jgi:hypothetical protein
VRALVTELVEGEDLSAHIARDAVGATTTMFSGQYRLTGRDFDVSPDGRRFIMMRSNEPRTSTTMHVVLNWWRMLDERMGRTR